MRVKKVYPGTSTLRAVKQLYYEAFPEKERLSFSRMVLLSLVKPSVSLLAYYEGDVCSGFTFTVEMQRFLYINYIAVNPQLRSRGLGRAILSQLEARWPKPQLCDAKAPEEGEADYQQDMRRLAFWRKNGFDFYENVHTITNPQGVIYYICGKGMDFDKQAYFSIFDHLSFGPGALLRSLRT